MNQKIVNHLHEIEERFSIRILYACELGSRAYGYFQENSDYDIRFIFTHSIKDYLGIFDVNETIQIKEGILEFHGWELKKAMKLALKSNPSLAEWLNSSIIYKEYFPFKQELLNIIQSSYSLPTLIKHYGSIFHKNIQRTENISTPKQMKPFIHAIRSLLCMNYLVKKQKVPPVELNHLLEQLTDKELKLKIYKVLNYVREQKIADRMDLQNLNQECLLLYQHLVNESVNLEQTTPSKEMVNEFVLKWVWGKREI